MSSTVRTRPHTSSLIRQISENTCVGVSWGVEGYGSCLRAFIFQVAMSFEIKSSTDPLFSQESF